MTTYSIVDAIHAIDQLRISERTLRAERDLLRRRVAQLEAERDTWRAKAEQ